MCTGFPVLLRDDQEMIVKLSTPESTLMSVFFSLFSLPKIPVDPWVLSTADASRTRRSVGQNKNTAQS